MREVDRSTGFAYRGWRYRPVMTDPETEAILLERTLEQTDPADDDKLDREREADGLPPLSELLR